MDVEEYIKRVDDRNPFFFYVLTLDSGGKDWIPTGCKISRMQLVEFCHKFPPHVATRLTRGPDCEEIVTLECQKGNRLMFLPESHLTFKKRYTVQKENRA